MKVSECFVSRTLIFLHGPHRVSLELDRAVDEVDEVLLVDEDFVGGLAGDALVDREGHIALRRQDRKVESLASLRVTNDAGLSPRFDVNYPTV